VEEKRDKEELQGGIPVEEKRGKEERRLQLLLFFAKDFGCCIAYRRESQLYEEDGICG